MLRRSMQLLAVCAVMCGQPLCAQDWQAGMLLTPLPDSTGKHHGQAGDSIRYRDANSRGGGFDIELRGETFRGVWKVRLTPTGESFAPFYIYHLLESADGLAAGEPGETSRRQLTGTFAIFRSVAIVTRWSGFGRSCFTRCMNGRVMLNWSLAKRLRSAHSCCRTPGRVSGRILSLPSPNATRLLPRSFDWSLLTPA